MRVLTRNGVRVLGKAHDTNSWRELAAFGGDLELWDKSFYKFANRERKIYRCLFTYLETLGIEYPSCSKCCLVFIALP